LEINLPNRFGLIGILSATAVINLLPLIGLLIYCLSKPGGAFSALGREGIEQLTNTLLLLILVGIGVACLGTGIGWLTASCRFPGKASLTVAQLLPLATPAYLQAAVLTDLGSRHGLRLHGLGWAAVVLSLSTLPYVVLLSRNSFCQSGRRHLEASRSLGLGAWASFRRVALPMALPAIASGVALAGMEVVNEFGAVELLGVPTLSTGILQRWQGEGNPEGASSLALAALAVVAILVAAVRWQRRFSRRWDQGGPGDQFECWRLRGLRAWLAIALCLAPPFLSAGLPLAWLAGSWGQLRQENFAELLNLSGRSLILGVIAAGLAVFMAFVLAVGGRWLKLRWLKSSMFMAGLGYAIPGAVSALALLIIFAPLGVPPLLLLIYGYGNRFLAVAKGGLDARLERLAPSIEEATTSLGRTWVRALPSVHLPILRSPMLLATLLVFVDTVKELPLTFALRPFNFDTLAVRVYQYASDERLGAALGPALLIVLLGIGSTFMLVPELKQEKSKLMPPLAG
jgi:iron(III) transport system permease protein